MSVFKIRGVIHKHIEHPVISSQEKIPKTSERVDLIALKANA